MVRVWEYVYKRKIKLSVNESKVMRCSSGEGGLREDSVSLNGEDPGEEMLFVPGTGHSTWNQGGSSEPQGGRGG